MTLTTPDTLSTIPAARNAYLLELIAGEEVVLAEAADERTALALDFPCCDSLGWMMLVGSECMISEQRVDTARSLVTKWRGQLAA